MKFDKTFESLLTSEWRQQYIRYVELRSIIRNAANNAPDPRNRVIYQVYTLEFQDEFFTTLTAELRRVSEFFDHKMAEARRKHATFIVKLMYLTSNGGEQPRLPPLADQPRTKRGLDRAYSEFYFSLVLLNNFQQLNFTGFYKLCGKFDRHFGTSSGTRWAEMYLDTSSMSQNADELLEMLVEVENMYTLYITNGDRVKALEKLRVPPLGQSPSPGYVFAAGVFLGLFIVSALVCIISYYSELNKPELLFKFTHLYRGPISLILYVFCLVSNVYVWQSVGINHVLIFELNPRNHTVPVKLLSIASFYGFVSTLTMLLFLHHNDFGVENPLYFPLLGLVLPLVLLFNPLPILNYPARMWVLNCFGRILAAPFCYVTFADFFLADQLISLVQCIVDFYHLIRFYLRYYLDSSDYFDFEPDYTVVVLRCLPSWFRLAQCIRRYWDSQPKPASYLVNAFGYASTLIVVFISTIQMETNSQYDNMFANPWTWSYLIGSLVSTIYCTAWDLLQDYGLFKVWKGKNIFLRERLFYPKCFYYFAILTDFSVRFVWALELYLISYDLVVPYNCKSISTVCEIMRRLIWNLMRLENEHLYNCGNYRATRDIYLSTLNSRDEMLVNSIVDDLSRSSSARKDSN